MKKRTATARLPWRACTYLVPIIIQAGKVWLENWRQSLSTGVPEDAVVIGFSLNYLTGPSFNAIYFHHLSLFYVPRLVLFQLKTETTIFSTWKYPGVVRLKSNTHIIFWLYNLSVWKRIKVFHATRIGSNEGLKKK
jgi:hypothetical protein